MRIAVFHEACGYPGGANTYRLRLQSLLEKRGHEIFLFTYRGDPVEGSGCHATVYPPPGRRTTGGRIPHHRIPSLSVYRSVRRWLLETSPDILHLHNNYAFTSSVLLTCHGLVPVVQTIHDFRMVCPTERAVTPAGRLCGGGISRACAEEKCVTWKRYALEALSLNLYRPLFHRSVYRLIAPSRALFQALERQGLPATHIPHYADTSNWPHQPLDKASDTILFVGFLHFSKGVGLLLKAFPRVLRAIPAARLLIAGDGPMMAELRSQQRQYGLGDEVVFLGSVSEERIKELHRVSIFAVLPSIIYENSPLTAYEAMACGRAMVGTRIGGIPELVVDQETGLLFERNNDVDLAEKIIRLLRDKDLAERMGKAARQRAEEEFPESRHIDSILALYDEARRARQ